MMKIKSILIILALLVLSLAQPAFADDEMETKSNMPVISEKAVAGKKAPVINALAAIVIEVSSGRVLYAKNAAVKRSIASTTKIMTAVVALENGKLEDEVTISKKAAGIGGSTIGLRTGQKFTLKELLYAMLMSSANDAAVAVAEHIGGTVEGFAKMMNRKAESLGASDSNFITPHGLDAANQYSTAYDVAIITRCALKNPVFAEIVSTTSSSIPGYGLYNTNELLGAYPGVDGVKTGYTGQAGRCLVTTIQKDGMRVITVVLGSPTRTARANASRDLMNYTFENFKMHRLLNAGDIYANVPVLRGIHEIAALKVAQNVEIPLSDAELVSMEVKKSIPDILNAPVYAGTDTGYVEYAVNGEVLAQSMLTISEDVRRKTFLDYLQFVLNSWAKMMREGIFAG
ncbi:MAG: D-alanyl-D-alanine carboxypeptidase family protein [Clostridiaceae bacterium]